MAARASIAHYSMSEMINCAAEQALVDFFSSFRCSFFLSVPAHASSGCGQVQHSIAARRERQLILIKLPERPELTRGNAEPVTSHYRRSRFGAPTDIYSEYYILFRSPFAVCRLNCVAPNISRELLVCSSSAVGCAMPRCASASAYITQRPRRSV